MTIIVTIVIHQIHSHVLVKHPALFVVKMRHVRVVIVLKHRHGLVNVQRYRYQHAIIIHVFLVNNVAMVNVLQVYVREVIHVFQVQRIVIPLLI
jgi:hypothetical protein